MREIESDSGEKFEFCVDENKFVDHIRAFRFPVRIGFNSNSGSMGLQLIDQTKQPKALEQGYSEQGMLPPLYPEWLGSREFQQKHSVRFSYVGGAMARGIASSEMVIALAKIGCLGFLGSAGLPIQRVEQEFTTITNALSGGGLSWGCNLIHTPAHLHSEEELVDLFFKYSVQRVSAAAFMNITPSLVRYMAKGLTQLSDGTIQRQHYIFAKISRAEVATHFMSPPPEDFLNQLLSDKSITAQEAALARQLPVAEDITIESDSGGHTDYRPLGALFPVIQDLKNRLEKQYSYQTPIRLGAAGGLGTPQSVAAAYALGADYVLIGSVHQSSVESGLSALGKEMLATVEFADTISTPSADMFEIGGKVQVLKKGNFMGLRGNQLLDIYNRYSSIDAIPQKVREGIERSIFKAPLQEIWEVTQKFFNEINPKEVTHANENPKYKMALIFRWYLGNSSKWAITGEESRKADFQIWCGPAMGAFNSWVTGTFLEPVSQRTVTQIALNLLEGAAYVTRAQQLRSYGVSIPSAYTHYTPKPLAL